MEKDPILPNYGKSIVLTCNGKKTIWKIYKHPDKVLDNLSIVEKNVKGKKPDKKWITSKDYLDWVHSLIENGYTYKIVDDKNEEPN